MPSSESSARVIHVVVGHGLPTYFMNAVRSIRTEAPDDDLLIIDNASPQQSLRSALRRFSAGDPRVTLRLRDANELENRKVGGLYHAYHDAVRFALDGEYDLLHIMQADMQMLYWNRELVAELMTIFAAEPKVVNILLTAWPAAFRHFPEVSLREGRPALLKEYGLADTGIYNLARWRTYDFQFHQSERSHASAYAERGFRVALHPLPPVCQVPWPAVMREGKQRGHEVDPPFDFILRPLDRERREVIRSRGLPAWLEDVCVPWGWMSLVPSWGNSPDSLDWFVSVYRRVRAEGREGLPRWDARGLCGVPRNRAQRRPHRRDLLFQPMVGTWRRRRAWRSARRQSSTRQ